MYIHAEKQSALHTALSPYYRVVQKTARSILQLDYWHHPHNIWSRVYVMVGCPSVGLSCQLASGAMAGGFAAEGGRGPSVDIDQ